MGVLQWLIGIFAVLALLSMIACAGAATAMFWRRTAAAPRQMKSSSTFAESEQLLDSWKPAFRELDTRVKQLEIEWQDVYARLLKRLNRLGGELRAEQSAQTSLLEKNPSRIPLGDGELHDVSMQPRQRRAAIVRRFREQTRNDATG
jgi:hypothetical protein